MLILSPIPKQFLDESGVPYTDGTVSIYLHGDTEFAEVYADAEGTALIENPCILDSHGMWQGFVDSDKPLDYIVKDSEGNVITRFCNISLPTGDDIPGVRVISSDGSINVSETLENGERTFDITVNDDMFKPSCAKFSHEAVNGGGQVSFDSFELEGDPDRDIYLTDGVITFAKGAYHISANLVIGNDECHNEYFGITANFGDCSTAKVWDRSFVHEESVEIGLDIVADVDGYTVVPTIAELPDDMHCSISRLYIHKVSGAGVGGSMASVEHDGTLVGDGTHNDPLGVKDWSEIRTTLENTANELLDHEVSPSAHQDIRDELERKEDKDNKVTSWGSTLSDEKYPSEKLVKDTIDNLPPGTAVKGDAESEYRTGNVNLTPANLGAKPLQTAVSDPSASGTGLDFIDTISQDASGVISPHKKTVQDGTTAQKGVVKLSNAIDSTSVTEAATPKAVKDAYDELNNKIVARAVFLSQAEWAVQSQLPGDPAKVYYVENGTGEDAYTVYVWKESTSTYEEVDESSIDLDGYWHDAPTTTGNGNVVTNITLGNDGVPQVEKGMSAEPAFSILPVSKGGTGKTNEKAALNQLTSQMTHYDTQPNDETLLVQKFGTPTDGNGALYTRPYSYLWAYIKSKISSVLGLSENGYTGNAATATSAGKLTASKTIAISGGATGTATAFDGSANITIPVTKLGFGNNNAQYAIPLGYNSLTGPRSGDDDSPYVQWKNIAGKAFTVGGATYYGYVLNGNSSATLTYGGNSVTINNTTSSNWVVLVIDDSTYLGSASFDGHDRGSFTLDGIPSHKRTIVNNYAIGSAYAVALSVGGATSFTNATTSATLLAPCATNLDDYSGRYSVALGCVSVASSSYSVASGLSSVASGITSVASGNQSVTTGDFSVASGNYSVASGNYSVASGNYSVASGNYSVASGNFSVASGNYSVASGNFSVASGNYSVASGNYSVARHTGSHVAAFNGISGNAYQHVVGKWNAIDNNRAFVVGWGTADNARKNVMSVGTDGEIYFKESNTGLSEQLAGKLGTSGDGSNVTSTFSKATGDTSSMTSGGKLSAIFTAISSFFASLKALAFKDKVSDSDINGTISNSHIADLPASKITSGTFGTSRIADDAITAAKVKDNETLPVNVSGSAYRLQWAGGTNNANSVGYIKLVTLNVSEANTANAGIIASVSWRDSTNGIRTGEGLLVASFRDYTDDTINGKILILNNRGSSGAPSYDGVSFSLIKISDERYELWGYVGAAWTSVFATVLSVAGSTSYPARSFQSTAPTGYSAIPYTFNVYDDDTAGVGSPTTPVYVGPNGQVQECNPSQMSVGNATKWDGHAISIGTVSSSAGTISIV